MLKRNSLFDKKIIKYKLWKTQYLKNSLIQSFKENHFIKPIERVSFFIGLDRQSKHYLFYKSQNRSQCYLSYSLRVPSAKVQLSRFYLNRGVDKLFLSNYQK